ncbi:hypothetical protein IM880_19705 [Pectobacterium polaris]|uniref:Uncharacterized protein n=1 Tax=Pectobacterium polaris TaxID=2042057 RepID=A0AAW4P567_9GAMM|nr:hypothetical protein [Pectobacterium polaris]MBW5894444.1 hypothetical protein [Pectobacterium polaris]
MNVVMTKAGILRHVGQLTSKNYAIGVKASRGGLIAWWKNPRRYGGKGGVACQITLPDSVTSPVNNSENKIYLAKK